MSMSVNPVLLQKVLRENASDLQDFSNDLKNWGDEMKRKENTINTPNQKPAPIKVRRVEKKVVHKKNYSRIGSTDYSKWEKFDVDAELERLDDDYEEDSELTDECNENMYDEAIVEKEKGNKFVKSQNWDEAIKCYTKAIDCYSFDPIFYANRALCYLKKQQYSDAERDCNLSLKLDGTYVKALQRRAAARIWLDKIKEAETDLLKVLELEPKNKESKIELDKLRLRFQTTDKISEQRPVSKFTASRKKNQTIVKPPLENPSYTSRIGSGEASESVQKLATPWPHIEEAIAVKPIRKPPHLQSKKPLKRVEIVEIDSSIQDKSEEVVKDHVLEKREMVVPPVAYLKEEIPDELPKIVSTFKKNKIVKTSSADVQASSSKQAVEIPMCLNTDDLKVVEKTQSKFINSDNNISIKNLLDSDKETMENEFSAPKNSVQFNTVWKNSKTPKIRYHYLKSIDPMNFPKIFRESLEASVFSDILEVLSNCFIDHKEPVYDILESFTNVRRFSAITMFLSEDDKKHLWKLFDYLRESQEKDNETIDILVQKYEM